MMKRKQPEKIVSEKQNSDKDNNEKSAKDILKLDKPEKSEENQISADPSPKKLVLKKRISALELLGDNIPYLKRTLRDRKKIKNHFVGSSDETGFNFVDYKSLKVPKTKVNISMKALLFLNLHAHLSKCEIIGLIGGRVENEAELSVEVALPCKNIAQ